MNNVIISQRKDEDKRWPVVKVESAYAEKIIQ